MQEEKKNKIIIYRYTGRQGFFTIPSSWCEECDLLIALVKKVIEEENLKERVELIIRPWWLWFPLPFLQHFAWHAPILIIDSKVISQGIVPKKEDVVKALKASNIK